MDESAGPYTKREYEVQNVPTGPHLAGRIIDYMGAEFGVISESSTGDSGIPIPLLNEQVSMEDREVISEPLVTGVKVCKTALYLVCAIECCTFVLSPVCVKFRGVFWSSFTLLY